MAVKKRKPKPLLIIICLLAFILFVLAGIWIFLTSPVNRNNKEEIKIEITSGTTTSQIATILKEKDLIKSELMFKVYVKLNNVNSLKASTYMINQSMSLDEIVKILEEGNSYNPNEIKITFKEGQRITDYIEVIANNTNHTKDEVLNTFNDKQMISELISDYWFLTQDILSEDIYYPLEGYLAPETYHFNDKDVEITKIITTMLDQTEKNLDKYKSKIENNPHNYITMASIVELEGTNTENRKIITGIFNNRLAKKMNLGSDVTTYYALQYPMTSDLTSAQFQTVNPYNTRSTTMIGKMPIGPICNPSASSLEASINPTSSDYLFFVADKNGKIYYTKTMQEHEAKVREIKENGDWIW